MNDSIKQNLIDAGCSEEFIKEFESCICDESKCERLLAEHRKELLEEVHAKEQNISCLDYLVFIMRKDGIR